MDVHGSSPASPPDEAFARAQRALSDWELAAGRERQPDQQHPPLAAAIDSFREAGGSDRLVLLHLSVRVYSAPPVNWRGLKLLIRTAAGRLVFDALPDWTASEGGLTVGFLVPRADLAAGLGAPTLDLGDGRMLSLPWPDDATVVPPPERRRRPRQFRRA